MHGTRAYAQSLIVLILVCANILFWIARRLFSPATMALAPTDDDDDTPKESGHNGSSEVVYHVINRLLVWQKELGPRESRLLLQDAFL
jgi:hypothetical protein